MPGRIYSASELRNFEVSAGQPTGLSDDTQTAQPAVRFRQQGEVIPAQQNNAEARFRALFTPPTEDENLMMSGVLPTPPVSLGERLGWTAEQDAAAAATDPNTGFSTGPNGELRQMTANDTERSRLRRLHENGYDEAPLVHSMPVFPGRYVETTRGRISTAVFNRERAAAEQSEEGIPFHLTPMPQIADKVRAALEDTIDFATLRFEMNGERHYANAAGALSQLSTEFGMANAVKLSQMRTMRDAMPQGAVRIRMFDDLIAELEEAQRIAAVPPQRVGVRLHASEL